MDPIESYAKQNESDRKTRIIAMLLFLGLIGAFTYALIFEPEALERIFGEDVEQNIQETAE